MSENLEHLDSLGYLINRAGKAMTYVVQSKLREKGVDLASEHMILLFILWKQDGINQKQIVGKILKDKSTITRGLTVLEKKNLIVRIQDDTDKRNKRLFLTHQGKSLKEEIVPLMKEVNRIAAQHIPTEDLTVCKTVLQQVFKNIDNI
ncbi:MAG: MarR family transcriptional regulator [Bacteroidota bacterium]